MPSCSECERRGVAIYQVSDRDSSRCAECVRIGRSRCDVQGISSAQLLSIVEQHQRLEAELEEAENRVFRLRKQKKLWFEKMMRAVHRGISSVEELEKVESEEAARKAARLNENRPPSANPDPIVDDAFLHSWDAVYPEVALSPSAVAAFVEDIQQLPVDSSSGS
jgi:hypothetical protein